MRPFGLTKYHFKIIGMTLGVSISIMLILLLLNGIYLQVPGIFWFALITSFAAQLSIKFLNAKINYEIAFGIGVLTLLLAHLALMPLWIIVGNNDIPFDTFFAYISLIFIIGVILQLIISLIFIKFRNP
jgi:hypothetical protein